MSFKTPFTGTKNTYLYVRDDANAYKAWTQAGTWIVPCENEPNNDFSTANRIESGILFTGAIEPIGDIDYFKFTVTKPGMLAIFLTEVPVNVTATIDLYDSNYDYITSAYNSFGTCGDISLQQEVTSAGSYYAVVQHNGGSKSFNYKLKAGVYSLMIRFLSRLGLIRMRSGILNLRILQA